MPYLLRNQAGKVVAVSQTQAQSDGWEEVAVDAKDYLDYLNTALQAADEFRETDIQLARVLEDLIAILIERDFIRFTDFPEAAQKRLIHRQGLRSKSKPLNLLEDEWI